MFSFCYRYLYLFPTQGNLGFTGTWFDHLTYIMHLALSCSSIIFEVLQKRIVSKPMIIWHEYRLHAMVFTLRCCSTYLIALYSPFGDTYLGRAVQFCFVLAHHLVVDEITRRHGPTDPNHTTVRVDNEGGAFTKAVLRFYAFYQFCALGSHLLPNARLADLGYNALIAIQSSAFLMTLFRKGLIRYYTHAVFYTGALFISLYYMIATMESIFWFKLVAVFGMRVKLRMDKYLIWFIYSMFSLPECEKKVLEVFKYLANN